MSAALRKRLASLEDASLRRRADAYALRFGVDADELIIGARRVDAEYNRLRRDGLSSQAAWRQVRERVASDSGLTLAELDTVLSQSHHAASR